MARFKPRQLTATMKGKKKKKKKKNLDHRTPTYILQLYVAAIKAGTTNKIH